MFTGYFLKYIKEINKYDSVYVKGVKKIKK